MTRSLLTLLALTALTACAGGDGEDSGHMHDHSDDYDINEATELPTDGGSYYVSYATEPSPIPYNEYFELTVMVHDNADHSVMLADADVAVDAQMPQHGHGMNTTPVVTPVGDGSFTVDGMLFHMQGYWQIIVEVDDAAGPETVIFEVDCCQ